MGGRCQRFQLDRSVFIEFFSDERSKVHRVLLETRKKRMRESTQQTWHGN